MKVYLVGVGPGNADYLTDKVKDIIRRSDIIIGYRYTINIIRHLIDGKDVRYITINTQDDVYKEVYEEIKDRDKICTIPFTGDINFSEFEMVERIVSVFGSDNIVIEPGISSIQVAAARSKVALDKSRIITFHVTGDIEDRKRLLIEALKSKDIVILLPRPWDFMPNDIAEFLKDNGISLDRFYAEVYEHLTLEDERVTRARLDKLPKKDYSDLTVMVIKPIDRFNS